MTETLRIGTRGSPLALAQTSLVQTALARRMRGVAFSVVPIVTQGDQDQRRSTDLDFTAAIDRALEQEEVDLAVHSTKDLPARADPGVRLAAFLPRADPRDCLVLHGAPDLAGLPPGARIGSSSPRRRAQLLRARPDLDVVELRGNVDTRLARLKSGALDGMMLARAGLLRLHREGEETTVLDPRRFLPAPGQGAIVVATRTGDRELARRVGAIDDARTHRAVVAERSFVEAVGGDCTTPLGALARWRAGRLTLRAEVLSTDGRRTVAGTADGPEDAARALGSRLGRAILRAGGSELLRGRGNSASPLRGRTG